MKQKQKINMGMIGVTKNNENYALHERELFSTIPPDDITNNEYIFKENN